MANYFEGGEFPLQLEETGLRKGRSIRDGYARGWGLQFGGLRQSVLDDPVYREAYALAEGRTIQAADCRMNLFLLARYFVPRMVSDSEGGSIVEFGSYQGGSAIFLAAVCRALGLNVKVYGLDTFEGMPPTNKRVDAHNGGDFSGVDLNALRAYVRDRGLEPYVEFVQGTFEETAPGLFIGIPPVVLAHIDCDVYGSVAYAWNAVKPFMTNGGYVAFDDAHTSSCLGATEVVEDLVIRRDGMNCEQIWPHFVFRVWQKPESSESGPDGESGAENSRGPILPSGDVDARGTARPEPELDSRLNVYSAQLVAARSEIVRLREQYLELTRELSDSREEIRRLEHRLAESTSALGEIERRFGTLHAQVSMAQRSRWLKVGRLFGVGPKFEPPE